MKVALLAGGFGTRLSEETTIKPKPMVEIGGRPIMWHIMKFYAHQGIRDFVVLGGYKVELIRDYFLHYRATHCDFSIDLQSGTVEWSDSLADDWRVTVLDRSEEHTSELQSLMRISYAAFCLKKTNQLRQHYS